MEAAPSLNPLARGALNGLLWAAALLVLFVLGGYQSIGSFYGKLALQVMAVVVVGGGALVALRRPTWRPNSWLLLPLTGLSVAYVLSTVFSERPRLSLDPGLGGLAFAGGFLVLGRVLQEEWLRRRFAVLVVALTSSVAVLYVVQVSFEWAQWWLAINRLAFPPFRPSWAGLTFGSPNLVAAFLVLAGPFTLALLRTLNAGHRAVWAMGAVLLLALLATGTRAAYLGLAVGALAGVVWILVFSPARPGFRIRRSTAAAGLAVPGVVLVISLPAIVHRLEQGGESIRFDLWRSALAIFQASPVFGSGPGTWVQLKTLANEPGIPNPVFSNAHSLYFQTAAELGIVGIAASIVLALAVLRLVTRGVRTPGPISRESVTVGVGLVAFAVQAAFDTLTNTPMVCLLIVAVIAWVDSGLERSRPTILRPERAIATLAPVVALLGIVVAGPSLIRADGAWASARAGDDAALVGDWATAVGHYDAASTADPDFNLYEIQLATALARTGQLPAARDRLAHAVRFDPVAVNLIGLAALERDLGDGQAALDLVRQALLLGDKELTITVNGGLIAESVGDIELALDQYAETVALAPELAESELWDAPERRVPKDAVIDAAIARTHPLNGALISSYAGRQDDALELVLAQPPSDSRDTYLAIVRWLGGDREGGLAGLRARLDVEPLDWHAAAWAARLSRRDGDFEAAVRYARWAYVVRSDVALSVVLEKEFDTERRSPYAGLDRSYPTGVYLRPPSPFLLMPQLVTVYAP